MIADDEATPTGGLYFAGEHCATESQGYMNEAARPAGLRRCRSSGALREARGRGACGTYGPSGLRTIRPAATVRPDRSLASATSSCGARSRVAVIPASR